MLHYLPVKSRKWIEMLLDERRERDRGVNEGWGRDQIKTFPLYLPVASTAGPYPMAAAWIIGGPTKIWTCNAGF